MGWWPQSKKKKKEKYFILDQYEICDIIEKSFGDIKNFHITDAKMAALTKDEMLRMLYRDKTDLNEYVKEFYDCDDFAFDLMKTFQRYAFGVAFVMGNNGGRHAVNVQIDPIEKVARLIEPQTDGQYTDYKFVYFILI